MSLPPLIPRALLFGDPEIHFPRISPDGTQLAYLAPHRGVLSIWLRAIDAPGDRTGDRVIAHDPERGIQWFEWQGDSRGVLYAQDRAGNENYHLFQAGLAGGPARDLCCGVDMFGPSNLVTMLESIPPYWKTLRAMFARRMGEDPELLAAHSPLPRAAAIRAPLLIGHGANDPRVTRHESDQLVAALRSNGIPVRYVVFDDEGHGFMHPHNARRFYAAVEAFLAEHLGGRAEPAQPDDIEPFLR